MTNVAAEHVVGGEAVLQAVRAAGILRDVAADRAHLLRRRVRCVEIPEWPHRFADLEIGHSRLNGDLLVVEVDVEDCAHPAEPDHDAVCHRERPTGETGSRAARDKRHLRRCACAHHLGHLLGAEGQHDRGR